MTSATCPMTPLTRVFLALALLLSASPCFAIIDDFSSAPGEGGPDGLDDVWQSIYNGWGLSPSGDEDKDGCSNFVECVAGSDPRSPGDCLAVGNLVIGATNVIMNFDAKKGKLYQVWQSDSPGGPSPGQPGTAWTAIAGAAREAAADGPDSIVFPKPVGDRKFYRLESKDADSDGDGLSDWAENKLGLDPGIAASPNNASGGAANDADTIRSLLSLTINSDQPDAYEKEGTPAIVSLQRSFGTMPLTVSLGSAPGATQPTKASAGAGDFVLKNMAGVTTSTVTLPANEGTDTPYEIARIQPVTDSTLEVPEALKVCVNLPGVPPGQPCPSTVVNIADANPENPANRTLYVAFLGREENVVSTASGYATALVDGDNNHASIGVVFNNLSSEQNTAYIRVGSDLEVLPLPLGQVSGAGWNIRAAQTEVTDQQMLDALRQGRLYVAISTANNPVKEIFGYFNRANGSTTFTPTDDLIAPGLGSPTWLAPTGDDLDREIWRFMGQSTFGGTTALHDEIRALCDAAIAGGGTYLDGLGAWLDKQIDPAQTPTVSWRQLVMAADMEEFMLRGNKPITYNNNPDYNGATYGVSYVNGVPMANTSVNNNPNNNNYPLENNKRREWWTMVTQARDQLRQRVTQALHEICVISERDATVATWHYGAANYWDMIAAGAFGKYRTLLENVSLSPMMGVYLTSVANRARYETSAGSGIFISPDENYAREIMQLFSIGLVLRHPDGSLQLSAEGLPIATYDNNDITELARVFTGFSFGARHGLARAQSYGGYGAINTTDQRISPTIYLNGTPNNTWFGRDNGHLYWQAPWTYPMKVIGRIGTTVYHDYNTYSYLDTTQTPPVQVSVPGVSKRLLAGKHGQYEIPVWDPTGQTDSATHDKAYEEVSKAHDCLAGSASAASYGAGTQGSPGHTNTPVNISRWLIQRLVTSNPSAGYIYRVQKVFRDNNGLLGPVVKAILLDYEARSLQLADTLISHGKIKEPLIHMTSLMRQFHAYSGASVTVLRNMQPPFSDTDAPMTGGYPASETAKFSTDNLQPPSKPAAWPDGPFRFRIDRVRDTLGQSPQDSPSVFNWFMPDFQPAGRFATNGLYGPELQISTEAGEVAKVNYLYGYTWMTLAGMSSTPGISGANFILTNAVATPAARFQVGGTFLGWPASITLDSTNWNTGVTVTMVPVNNTTFSQMAGTSVRYTVSGSATGYPGVATPATPLTFIENERLNESLVIVQPGGNTWVAEGIYDDTIGVKLSCSPMAGATVTVTPAVQNGEITVTPASLSFDSTNWNTSQSLTVSAVDDSDPEDAGTGNDSITLSVASDLAVNWMNIAPVAVAVGVTDNDGGADVLIRQTAGTNTAVIDGVSNVNETGSVSGTGTDNYSIVLTKAPTASVTVSLVANGQPSISTSPTGTAFTTGTTTRVFSTTNWNVAQNVTVRGSDDTTAELLIHTGTITHSIATTAGGYTAGMPLQQIITNITDNDTAIVLNHTDGETRVEENGVTDTITVQLRNGTVPNQDVSVMLGSTQVKFNPPALTFTSANYNQPQIVSVIALDDYKAEGLHSGSIYAYSTSAGTNYNGSTSVALPVTVIDNDDSRLRVIETEGNTYVNEDGTTDTYDLALSRAPAVGSLTTVTLTGSSGLTITPPGPFTFTDANWNQPQTVTVAATTNDGTAEPVGTTTITHTMVSTDPVYNKANTPVLLVTIGDNDPPLNVTLTNFATNVKEGGTPGTGGTPNLSDSFTVSLARAPGASTPVTVNLIAGSQFSVNPSVLTFTSTNYTIAQSVIVTATDDADPEPTVHASPITFAISSADAYFNGAANPPVMVYVTDNDSPGVSIVESGDITQVTEGSNTQDSYTVVLTQAPSANVDVVVNGGTQALLSKSGTPNAATITLNFTPANWSAAQTVNVLAVNDTLPESGRQLSPITHAISTADPNYAAITIPDVNVVITDNDLTVASNKVRIADTSGNTAVTESGSTATDTFTVVLGVAPTANVTVSFTSPDNQLSLVNRSSITFTPTTGQAVSNGVGGWNVTQTLTVRANDDKIIEPFLHWGTLSATVTSSDPNYSGISIPVALTSSLRDNDAPSVRIIPTDGSTQLTESGQTDSYSIALNYPPTSDVTITFAPDAQITTDVPSLTFTTENWSTPQSVTLSAINDTDVEVASHTGVVSHIVTSADPIYNGLGIPTLTATIWDNDSPGIDITQTGGTTVLDEGNATGDQLLIKLNTAPAPGTSVTITLHPPTYLVPVPQHGKAAGYFLNDYGTSAERDNIVFDYTESILDYRAAFYSSLTAAYAPNPIPATLATSTDPADLVKIQNAHWAATKVIVNKMDLWFSGGGMKARWPVLIEPNQPSPDPLPAFNPRQAIMDAVYRHSGGSGSPATTRYAVQAAYNPQSPPTATFDTDIRDRVRWCAYLCTVGTTAFSQH